MEQSTGANAKCWDKARVHQIISNMDSASRSGLMEESTKVSGEMASPKAEESLSTWMAMFTTVIFLFMINGSNQGTGITIKLVGSEFISTKS